MNWTTRSFWKRSIPAVSSTAETAEGRHGEPVDDGDEDILQDEQEAPYLQKAAAAIENEDIDDNDDFDSFEEAASMFAKSEQTADETPTALFDRGMLSGLLDTLGKEALEELMEGFWAKASDIVTDIEKAAESGNRDSCMRMRTSLKGWLRISACLS
ncbi:MAG: hypothetical protein R3D66_05725 [Alphaproteobacteria bacterium]